MTQTQLYPKRWRQSYGTEFEALLEEHSRGLSTVLDVMGSALGERIFPTQGGETMAVTSRMEGRSGPPAAHAGE